VIPAAAARREPFDFKSEWFDIKFRLPPDQADGGDLELVTASSISPSGMKLGRQVGLGVISVASYSEEGRRRCRTQWGFAETYAKEHGQTVSRDRGG